MNGTIAPPRPGSADACLGSFAAAAICSLQLSPSVVAAALPTSTSLSAAQTTVVAGDPVLLTASVVPAPGGGAVTFTSSQFGFLGSAEIDPDTNTAELRATLAPGTHSIIATFGGAGDFTGSSSLPVTILATLGSTTGTADLDDPHAGDARRRRGRPRRAARHGLADPG